MAAVEAEARIEELAAKARFYAEEPWKKRHEEVNACYRLERHIMFGVRLFDSLSRAEAHWRGIGLVPQDESLANELDAVWDLWLVPCAKVDEAIQGFERLGYGVDQAAEFRERCTIARRRPKVGTSPGTWRHAVKTGGKLFGRPILTKEDMQKKTGPFPDE